jgi:hypothetical protein
MTEFVDAVVVTVGAYERRARCCCSGSSRRRRAAADAVAGEGGEDRGGVRRAVREIAVVVVGRLEACCTRRSPRSCSPVVPEQV